MRWRFQSSRDQKRDCSLINGKIRVHPHVSVYGTGLGSLGLYGDLTVRSIRKDTEADSMAFEEAPSHTNTH